MDDAVEDDELLSDNGKEAELDENSSDSSDTEDADERDSFSLERSKREARKSAQVNRMELREKERNVIKEVRRVLNKKPYERSIEDSQILETYPEAVHQVNSRMSKQAQIKERLKEIEDPIEELDRKCQLLAEAISRATFVVVYTGAGISTAAQIPDYRGPSGVWTLLKRGQEFNQSFDLSVATPTFSHMALYEMYNRGIVRHIVSQNCDGLHLRSGINQNALSEVHGNMFIEVCTACKPVCQYIRLFDVTEKTALHRHLTGRRCHRCCKDLRDSIVHFGERGKLRWPLNWEGAAKMAKKADLILCLGSSLKVLRRYPCLWYSRGEKAKLFIVNLQWTPKDEQATLKINGKCDDVMTRVMQYLNIAVPKYVRSQDPIFQQAIPLRDREIRTASTRHLSNEDETEEDKVQTHSIAFSEENKPLFPDQSTKSEGEDDVTEEKRVKLEDVKIEPEKSDQEAEKATKIGGGGWFGKGLAKMKKNKNKK